MGRVRERPEVVALALLLASLLLLRRWGASPENRPRTGLALVAAGLLWAQVHGTAPLLAPMALVSVAPSLLDHLRTIARPRLPRPPRGRHRRGASPALRVRAHSWRCGRSRGDAVAHLTDMHRPLWESFDPTAAVMGPAFAALLLLGLGGMLHAGRCWPRRLGWAALGCPSPRPR
ncbi:MAG: hypothetical protein IPF99_38275 [Deltaproteobacteria bacterium]|nr:hypothetical protein [Deltaproteobacteria bacterium]